jgi:hypothetical protein
LLEVHRVQVASSQWSYAIERLTCRLSAISEIPITDCFGVKRPRITDRVYLAYALRESRASRNEPQGVTHLYDGTMPLYGIAHRDTRVGGDTEPRYSGLLAHACSRDLA